MGQQKKKGRPWGSKNRNQSKKAAKKRKRKSSRTNKNFAHKKGLSGIISSATKTSYRKADLVSKRKYIIKKMPCLHLTAEMRKILQTAWNAYINSSTTITIRHFALVHGLSTETWRREFKRGALGLIQRKGNKWLYPEYSADKAIDSINEGKSNMGTKMKMTVAMAMMFRHFVKNLHRSPSDARAYIVKALPEAYIPCLRTFYNHIYSGDMGVYHGETPYHPGRRRKPRQLPHPAKTVPGRRSIADRPNAALARLEIGHWEMDTIVSGRSGKGGLLVLVDRFSRKYLIEHINHNIPR